MLAAGPVMQCNAHPDYSMHVKHCLLPQLPPASEHCGACRTEDDCPAAVIQLVRDCCLEDPHLRPTAVQVVRRLEALAATI